MYTIMAVLRALLLKRSNVSVHPEVCLLKASVSFVIPGHLIVRIVLLQLLCGHCVVRPAKSLSSNINRVPIIVFRNKNRHIENTLVWVTLAVTVSLYHGVSVDVDRSAASGRDSIYDL